MKRHAFRPLCHRLAYSMMDVDRGFRPDTIKVFKNDLDDISNISAENIVIDKAW